MGAHDDASDAFVAAGSNQHDGERKKLFGKAMGKRAAAFAASKKTNLSRKAATWQLKSAPKPKVDKSRPARDWPAGERLAGGPRGFAQSGGGGWKQAARRIGQRLRGES